MLSEAQYNAERCYDALLDKPDDDTIRGIYADALDEEFSGLSPRGEFIRVQCELARNPQKELQCPHCSSDDGYNHNTGCLYSREYELLEVHRRAWLTLPCVTCEGTGVKRRSDGLHRDECPDCNGTGDAGGLTWPFDYSGVTRSVDLYPVRVEFARGSPFRVTVPRLADCTRTKIDHDNPGSSILKPSRWLAAVVRHHPVTEVVCLDRGPFWNDVSYSWYNEAKNFSGQRPPPESCLPDAIFRRLKTVKLGLRLAAYKTPNDAVTDLARAVPRWAREHAGSPSGG